MKTTNSFASSMEAATGIKLYTIVDDPTDNANTSGTMSNAMRQYYSAVYTALKDREAVVCTCAELALSVGLITLKPTASSSGAYSYEGVGLYKNKFVKGFLFQNSDIEAVSLTSYIAITPSGKLYYVGTMSEMIALAEETESEIVAQWGKYQWSLVLYAVSIIISAVLLVMSFGTYTPAAVTLLTAAGSLSKKYADKLSTQSGYDASTVQALDAMAGDVFDAFASGDTASAVNSVVQFGRNTFLKNTPGYLSNSSKGPITKQEIYHLQEKILAMGRDGFASLIWEFFPSNKKASDIYFGCMEFFNIDSETWTKTVAYNEGSR